MKKIILLFIIFLLSMTLVQGLTISQETATNNISPEENKTKEMCIKWKKLQNQ